MRHIINRIALLSAALMIIAVPVLADDMSERQMGASPEQSDSKNECLIVAQNNCDRVTTFSARIEELQEEISKGSAVYTNEELRLLNQRLRDTLEEMQQVEIGGV